MEALVLQFKQGLAEELLEELPASTPRERALHVSGNSANGVVTQKVDDMCECPNSRLAIVLPVRGAYDHGQNRKYG
jgi:hypothetical protein